MGNRNPTPQRISRHIRGLPPSKIPRCLRICCRGDLLQHVAVDIQLFCQYVCFGCFLGVARERNVLSPIFAMVITERSFSFFASGNRPSTVTLEIRPISKFIPSVAVEHSAPFRQPRVFPLRSTVGEIASAALLSVGYYQVIYGKAHRYFGKRTRVIHVQVGYERRVQYPL